MYLLLMIIFLNEISISIYYGWYPRHRTIDIFTSNTFNCHSRGSFYHNISTLHLALLLLPRLAANFKLKPFIIIIIMKKIDTNLPQGRQNYIELLNNVQRSDQLNLVSDRKLYIIIA